MHHCVRGSCVVGIGAISISILNTQYPLMSSSQSDLEPEHASVEFFTKTSTTFGKTHFLARYIGFPPAYDELIPEEELIIKYDDPLLPNLESGVLRKQATQQEQSASQTLPVCHVELCRC